MAYLDETQLRDLGFKQLGKGVKISDRASIYNADRIEIGDESRIDDFCVISGNVKIGSFCHVVPMCLFAGGAPGLVVNDFCTFAYGVKVFTQSDDYSGESLTNSLIPERYKAQTYGCVTIDRHTIIGANSVVFPGVHLAEGTAVGAMTLVIASTEPWGIYVGIPAKRTRDRSRNLLKLEQEFLRSRS